MSTEQRRFSLTPLYTTNRNNAIPEEMLIDSNTGLTSYVNDQNILIDTGGITRLKNHANEFMNHIMCNGMVSSSVYNLEFDEYKTSRSVTIGENILDNPLELSSESNNIIHNALISIDLDTLKVNSDKMLMDIADINPTIEINYTSDADRIITSDLFRLPNTILPINTISFKLNSIRLITNDSNILSNYNIILHSILIAY